MTLPVFNQQLEALRRRRQIEDEEFLGRAPKRRRRRRLEETERKLGATSYVTMTDINFFAPSFLVETSRGLANVRIPSVSFDTITKCDVPRSPDGITHPRYPDQAKAAEGHFGYIERQERAARNKVEGHLIYIEREEARDGDPDSENYGHVLTNIHPSPDVRRDFARRIWAAERAPHAPRLLAWSSDVDWWAEVASQPDAPDWVRTAAECLARAVKKAEAKQKAGKELKPFQVDLGTTTLEEAYERLVWSDEQMEPGDLPKLDFSSRYGGRVQQRLVFELPYGLTARERFEVARGIARWCKHQRFMYVIAIHKPDGHNDSRNFHVHVDFYDRPCRWLKRFGMWDFEVTRKAANGDLRYPYRQRKRLSLEESREGAWWKQREQFLKRLRTVVVETTNEVLERSGLSMRFHAGPATELGLDITPMQKLGGRKMAAERAGLETREGTYSADALWGDRKRHIEAAHAAAVKLDNEILGELRAKLFATGRAHNVSGMELQSEIAAIGHACDALRQRRLQLDMVKHEFDKARSRAEVVLREAAKADARQALDPSFKNSEFRTRRPAIVADARRHLEYLASIAPKKEELAEVESDIALLERSVHTLRQRALNGIAELTSTPKEKEIRLAALQLKSTTIGKALTEHDAQRVERLRSWLKVNRNHLVVKGETLVVEAPQAILTIIARHYESRDVRELLGLAVIDHLLREAREGRWLVREHNGTLQLPLDRVRQRPLEYQIMADHLHKPVVQTNLRRLAEEQGRDISRLTAAIEHAEWASLDAQRPLINDAFPDFWLQIERWRHANEVREALARRREAAKSRGRVPPDIGDKADQSVTEPQVASSREKAPKIPPAAASGVAKHDDDKSVETIAEMIRRQRMKQR